MTDLELLRQYAASNSEEAFAAIVRKYGGLVHAAARRQTSDTRDAEEIAQAVFVILAQKASKLPANTVLSGWLLRTTHFVALNARRKLLHRPQTEPMDPNLQATNTSAAWAAMAPVLDEALATLSESNRNAVSLRFFEGYSFKEVAGIMGVSEDAAQKRVSRALELLRARFSKRGVALSTTLLAGALGTHAIEAAAPQVLAASLTTAGGTGKVAVLVKRTLEAIVSARRRLMLRWGAVALIGLMSFLGIWQLRSPSAAPLVVGTNAADTNDNASALAEAPSTVSGRVQAAGMRLRVVDADTGNAIENALVTARQNSSFPDWITNTAASEANGECRIPVSRAPTDDWSLYVEVIKAGYALQFANWSSARGDMIEDVPEQYQAGLTRASAIGGVVLNTKSEPLAGVTVEFSGSGNVRPELQRLREGLVDGPGYHSELTDAEGRWRCDHAPRQFESLIFRVAHPHSLPARFGVTKFGATESAQTVHLAEEDYRRQAAVMVLKPGLVVNGSVADEQGNPIAGAKVIVDRNWQDPWSVHWTGADGRFRLSNVSSGELVVAVEADGFVACDQTIRLESPGADLRFALAPAVWLRGRVVDEVGVPIRATVSAMGGDFGPVKSKAAIYSASEIKNARFDWSVVTDIEGRFEWRSAPSTQALYNIQAPAYETVQRLELVADGVEHLITLRRSNRPPPPSISGTVTDERTGQPINDFQVWMASSLKVIGPNGTAVWARMAPVLQTTGKEGRFKFPCRESSAGCTLQINADGYVTVQKNIPGPLTNSCRFDFTLTMDKALAGTVLTPEGQPASGATVMPCSEKNRTYMNLPGQFNLSTSGATRTTTDSDGHFSLSSIAEAKQIMVAHKSGFADVAPDAVAGSHSITLQSWGRIEGSLKIGSRWGNGETILLGNQPSLRERPCLGLIVTVTTDAAGRFTIENVPPGEWEISHQLAAGGIKNGLIPRTQSTPIAVKGGQTTQVALGGKGWKVVGKVRTVSVTEPINWQRDLQTLRVKTPVASAASRQYALVFDPSGAFAIDDVPSGNYELNILVTAPGPSGGVFDEKRLGALHQEIVVPENSPGDEPPILDVGVLDLRPINLRGGASN